jgi:hypothetical protein
VQLFSQLGKTLLESLLVVDVQHKGCIRAALASPRQVISKHCHTLVGRESQGTHSARHVAHRKARLEGLKPRVQRGVARRKNGRVGCERDGWYCDTHGRLDRWLDG